MPEDEKDSATNFGSFVTNPWGNIPEKELCRSASDKIFEISMTILSDISQDVIAACGFPTHIETMICAIGGITGFASQRTLLSLIAANEISGDGFNIVELKDGRHFLFGEPLNDILISGNYSVYCLGLWDSIKAMAAASHRGSSGLPRLDRQFDVVNERLGQTLGDFPDVEQPHRPVASISLLMQTYWPRVRNALGAGPHPSGDIVQAVPERYWASVMDTVAARIFQEAIKHLSVDIAASILMQSAIYGSKVKM